MTGQNKQYERELRAERLVWARKRADLGGPRRLSQRFGWNENKYKSHESGRNGFDTTDAKAYAKAFNVSLQWLLTGEGSPDDAPDAPRTVIDVPLISWVSAGQLTLQDAVMPSDDFRMVATIDLPQGHWVALRVEGDSMNKISPPGSIIFANLKDKALIPNGLYIVADETGAATYKRYRPNERPPFQPASYENVAPPQFEGVVSVIGRVRRSVIDM